MYRQFRGNFKPPYKGNFNIDKSMIKKLIILGIILILAAVALFTSYYTVDEKEQAVVTTFGKVTSITEAGFHFKAPFGIQKVQKVPVNVYQKLEIGYKTDKKGNVTAVEEESKMITGDYNIVNIDFFVEYRISDPEKYLFSSQDPDEVLKNLAQSQIRNVVGSATVDSVLTDGKSEIQMQVKELVTEILAEYDIGLSLSDVKIQDSEPPTATVTEAFKAVETAKQSAETAENQANAYKNAQIPKAEANANKLLQNAEYLKTKRINEAKEQIALFNAMYTEYSNSPDITRSRMYYEMITQTLSGVKVYIGIEGDDTQTLLPLDKFTQS
ncbi:MAG: FtsH protease activity modulator HflK [Ruminococcaceae bacterium]|nr:FtsH protease activity modulator HflK [Oscillospiraceae bacterium]